MIDSEVIKNLVIDFNVALIKARGSENIEEAVEKLREARRCIEKIGKIIPEMKQEELDLTQDLYNKFKDLEKPYGKTIKFHD